MLYNIYVSPFYLLLAATVVSVAGIFYFRWWSYFLPYRINKKGLPPENEGFKGRISIIIPCHDQADELKENLPQFLEQDYPDFEVIVVNDASTDETEIILKAYKKQYENLRHTFIPKEAYHTARKKLAITLGIRAARSEWIVLTEASCKPIGPDWLKTLARHFRSDADFVLGYATYTNDGQSRTHRAIYERMKFQFRYVRAALSGKGIGGDECNLCVRKSFFLQEGGYADNLFTPLGSGELLVSSLATKGNTLVCLFPEAMMRQELPPIEVLRNMRVHKMEALRYTSLRGKCYRLREAAASLLSHAVLLMVAAYVYLRAVSSPGFPEQYPLQNLYSDIPLLVVFLFYLLCPILLLRKSTKSIGEQSFGAGILIYDLLQPYKNFLRKVKRWYRRKEFRKR